MSEETDEQRRAARLQARLGVRYKIGERIVTGTSVDLSENGVFIHSGNPSPEGTEVFMEINLGPGEPTIKAVGVVRRSLPQGGLESAGMGVEFKALYGIDQKALKRFIKLSFGREISEDSFGGVGQDNMLKFVFEPEDGDEGTEPEAEPFIIEPNATPHSVHETYGASVPPQVGPSSAVRAAKQRARESADEVTYIMNKRDERYLAELRRLENSNKQTSLRQWVRLFLIVAALGGAFWWMINSPGFREYITRVFNAVLGG